MSGFELARLVVICTDIKLPYDHDHEGPYVYQIYPITGLLDIFIINNVLIIKIKVFLLQTQVTVADIGYSVYALWFTCSKTLLNHLTFHPLDFERTC